MEKEIIKKLKLKIAISKIKEEKDRAMNRKRSFISKKIGVVACACLILMTGVAFSKDIEKYFRSLFTNSTQAIDMAVENDYVQNEEMEYVYDQNIGVKVDSLIIDDFNLDVSFNLEIKEENVKSIRFNNFTITNDNDKVVYRTEFKYAENYEDLPLYNTVDWGNEPQKLTDTTFTDSILIGLRAEKEEFSKLYFDVTSIDIIYTDGRKEVVDGSWKFDITINEKMIKSTTAEYILKDGNEYVEDCTAKMSATGTVMELNLFNSFDSFEYIKNNIDKIRDMGLFYIKYEDSMLTPSFLEYGNIEWTKFIIHYDNIGIFDNVDSIELYLEPFDSTITLVRK